MTYNKILLYFLINLIIGCSTLELKPIKIESIKNKEFLTNQSIGASVYSKMLNYNLSSDKQIDDQTFVQNYLNSLDFNKDIFLEEDLDVFSEKEKSLHLNLLNAGVPLILKTDEILKKRIERIIHLWRKIQFSESNIVNIEYPNFIIRRRNLDRFKNDEEWESHWESILHYRIFDRYLSELSEENKDELISEEIDLNLIKKIYNEVKKDSIEDLIEFSKMNYSDYFNVFLNSIVMYFDPHSQYFPPAEGESFRNNLKGQMNGFGFVYNKTKNGLKISNIYPNSPASRSNLKKDDIIVSVKKINEDQEISEITYPFSNKVFNNFLSKIDSEQIIFKVKEKNLLKEIEINQDIFDKYEENIFYSLISNQHKKHGYIKINSFYRDFSESMENSKNNVYSDIKEVLTELMKEEIDSLTIDLRDNRGGSLIDAIYISGLFIDNGPIVLTKNLFNQVEIYEDINEGIFYDGKLNILINEYSASASEIMASALQDYNRATILGTSPHSFGKGTVQKIIYLNQSPYFSPNKDYGILKITSDNFYRISGKSIQELGVTPDIILENRDFSNKETVFFEKNLPFHIKKTEIEPAQYSKLKMIERKKELALSKEIKELINIDKELDSLKIKNGENLSLKSLILKENKILNLRNKKNNINLFSEFNLVSKIHTRQQNKEVESFLKQYIDEENKRINNDYLLKKSIDIFY